MTPRKLTLTAASLAIAVSALAQGQGPRQDGNWEIKVEMQMAGMTMPPQTIMQCITPAQAADPKSTIPSAGGPGPLPGDCKVGDYKTAANKVTWSISCPSQQMDGSGDFTYVGDTYTGTMKMKVQGQEMSVKYSGKRLGDCTK